MISTEQLIEIFTLQRVQLGADYEQALQETRHILVDDHEFAAIMHNVAGKIWQLGYEAGRPQPLATQQKCEIANRYFNGISTMEVIETTERLLLTPRPM